MDVAVRLLNGLLMIAMPIALGIYLVRRTGQRWKLFLVGAVLFVASQVLHIPFNLIVLNPILEQIGFGQGAFGAALLLGALLLGLSAGLFEELREGPVQEIEVSQHPVGKLRNKRPIPFVEARPRCLKCVSGTRAAT